MHLADPVKTAVPAPVSSRIPRRFLAFVLLIAGLMAAFGVPLYSLALHAAHSNLHSYILLIPFVSAYLIYTHWNQLPREYGSAFGCALLPAAVGSTALVTAWRLPASGYSISLNDHLSLIAFSFVCFIWSGGYAFLGSKWMRAAAFPIAFLAFVIPLPDVVVDYLENASKLASAEVASFLFNATGTPVLRDGTVFQLPGITIEVAKECSGIRSSLVLLITSLLASYLFLRSRWRRVLLSAVVIPLGLLRNGFRILVISLLCVRYGPQMIHSLIHRRGGPIFFTASLVPLFLLLWWLRRSDVVATDRNAESEAGKVQPPPPISLSSDPKLHERQRTGG
jgi:exosortase C (VPDSG-CTERM-specific)